MLELKNINFAYGKQNIFNDFSLKINCGECVQLCGMSGCGKTTIARLLLGLETPISGEIIAPEKISVVFQEDRLLENADVLSNIRLPLAEYKFEFADALLKQFGLYDVRKKRISNLSGGMKRRVALIRAIAYGGDALILDEAFNGLDADNKRIAADVIKSEFLEKNKPVLLITHIKDDGDLFNAKTVYL